MEPKLPSPNHGPEQAPAYFSPNLERGPAATTPERAIERGYERREGQPLDTQSQNGSVAPILPSPVIISQPPVSDDTKTTDVDDTPLLANDDDLIEKEWVDKAKKIIAETKDDPYRREQEVGRLQADYLRKRYGRELGTSQ